MLLDFVQTGTENAAVCATFLRSFLDRGLRVADGLLLVIDGGNGLRCAVRGVFGDQTPVQRRTWHKRENVEDYLPKRLQPAWQAKLQPAYRQPTYATAQAALHRLQGDLRRLNKDAAKSLAEGLVETPPPPSVGPRRSPGDELVRHEWAGVHPGAGRGARGQKSIAGPRATRNRDG